MRRCWIREKHGIRLYGRLELYWGRWQPAFELVYSGSDGDEGSWPWILHVCVAPFELYLHLPLKHIPSSKREPYLRDWQRWGLSFCDDALHMHWNERSKVWWLPWLHKIHQRSEVRRADGTWVPFVGGWERDKSPDGREAITYPYRYVLRNGTVQNRTAAIYVKRRAWRPKWFCWTSLFEKQRQSISVEFSDEVGEQTGSWKGGCIGCEWEMLPNESPEQSLRRMEKERVFR